MDEEYSGMYISIEDDEGNEFEMEILGNMEYNNKRYVLLLPADGDENDPDYGYVILIETEDENGEPVFESIETDEELNDVYERFMALLFEDEEEEGTPEQ